MPRKGRQRSAAQIRQAESMRKMRWASPGEAEKIGEEYRRVATEQFKNDRAKAEQELKRMTEKVEATNRQAEKLREEADQAKKLLKALTKERAHRKEITLELQHALRRTKSREARRTEQISNALDSATTALANPGKPLLPPGRRIEERVFESDAYYGDPVGDDIDVGDHYEFGQDEGGPVPDTGVAGPSNAVTLPLEKLSEGKNV